jgi:hypothetical protein
LQTFETRDLPDRIDDLSREAESGGLSIVTRDGRPTLVLFADVDLNRNGHDAFAGFWSLPVLDQRGIDTVDYEA